MMHIDNWKDGKIFSPLFGSDTEKKKSTDIFARAEEW